MSDIDKIREVLRLIGAEEIPEDEPHREAYGSIRATLDGRLMVFRYGAYGYKGRYKIGAGYPRANDRYVAPRDCLPYDQRPRFKDADITVSAEKTAEQIAKDIQRRFIPRHKELWDLVKAEVDKIEAAATRRNEMREQVAKALGGTVRNDNVYVPSDRIRVEYVWESYADIRVSGCTLAQLKQIAEIMRAPA